LSVFSYKDSVIDEITFKKTANGAVRAYLHGAAGVSADTFETIRTQLHDADFETIPFTLNDKPALEVRGFNKEPQLLAVLDKNGWVKDKPQIKKDPEDNITWWDWFRKRTMQLSGVAMALADTGFIIYGIKEAKNHKMINPQHKRDFSEALAGFCYLGGSAVLTMYGRNDQSDLQIRDMAKLILQNAKERGLDVEGSAAAKLGDQPKETILTQVDNFFRKYPSEIGNMMYFSAGAFVAQAALRNRALSKPRPEMTAEQIHKMRLGGWGDTALGSLTMASGLLATLGKEKAADPDAPKKTGISGFTDWLWRNPLAMASYGYIGSTLFHTFTTYVERNEALRAMKDMTLTANERLIATQKAGAVPWRVMFIVCTLIGEFLLSISSKGHGEGVVSDNSVDTSAVAIMADLIVKQPLAFQDSLIEQMGKFLGSPDVLAMPDTEAVEILRKQVEALRQNPWAKAKGQAETATAEPIPAPAVITPAQEEKPAPNAWQAKLNAAAQQSAHLQTSV